MCGACAFVCLLRYLEVLICHTRTDTHIVIVASFYRPPQAYNSMSQAVLCGCIDQPWPLSLSPPSTALFTEVPHDIVTESGQDVEMACSFRGAGSPSVSLEIQWWYIRDHREWSEKTSWTNNQVREKLSGFCERTAEPQLVLAGEGSCCVDICTVIYCTVCVIFIYV